MAGSQKDHRMSKWQQRKGIGVQEKQDLAERRYTPRQT
jgi:hypothetical protein